MIIPPETPHNTLGQPKYRFKRGSKLADLPPVPPESPVLSALDGPFQLAEYLALKVRHDPHDIKGLVDVPTENAKAADCNVWIYEHLRRIPIDATPLITELIQLCDRDSCPEMKADEWLYLCVAHGGGGTDKCCAIDYILHTLDSTSALLNSSNYFPSRLQIPNASVAHFPSLFRRLSRIFSHAYFHHREAFTTSEAETSLYARFAALCQKYELVGSQLLIIPASGYEVMTDDDDDDDNTHHDDDDDKEDEEDEMDEDDDHHEAGSRGSGDKSLWSGATNDDDAHHDDEDGASRGRDSDDSPASSRSHSLGRHPYSPGGKWSASSPVQPANKGKPAPAQASESLSPPSTRSQLDATDPILPTTVQGRGTLSRGKGTRGSAANVWPAAALEAGSPPSGGDAPASMIGMARKESVDSVVHIGPSDGESDTEQLLPSSSSPPKLDLSPNQSKVPLKVDTTETIHADTDTDNLVTPTPGEMPPLPVTAPCPAAPTPSDEVPSPATPASATDSMDTPVLKTANSAPLAAAGANDDKPPAAVAAAASSPPKSQASPASTVGAKAATPVDLLSPTLSPKSELLPVSPKSELLSVSPKSELLSVSPKSQSPMGKRGNRGGKAKAPKSPKAKSPASVATTSVMEDADTNATAASPASTEAA